MHRRHTSNTVARQCAVLTVVSLVCGLPLSALVAPAWAAEATVARLSFWLRPEKMAAFESTYADRVVPILVKHGLVESPEIGRTAPDSVFSLLFEVEAPGKVEMIRGALQADPALQEELRRLGSAFGTAGLGSPIRYDLRLYTTLIGPGRAVEAGPGRVVSAGHGRGHWRGYDVTDGLPNGIVFDILQGREGQLWIATQGGVCCYDGQTWTTFTTRDGLAHNWVWSTLEDREGHLWFATQGGVSRYDGETWTTWTTQDGLVDDRVVSVLQDREGLFWFTTHNGVSRYDGQGFTNFTVDDGLADNRVASILQDRSGHFWFGTHGGVSRYDGQTFVSLTTEDGLADPHVWSILEDREGDLWFATQNGVSRYDGVAFSTYTERDGLGNNEVHSVLQDREGHLWFCTDGGGVTRYDGASWSTYTTQDGLVDNVVSVAAQDSEGHLWFGTWGGGLCRYDGRTFTTFGVEHGLGNDYIYSILEDREGNLWFGTGGFGNVGGHGVSRYDGRTWTTFSVEDGLAHNRVASILQDREGALWFGTWGGGVSRYDGRTFTTYTTRDGLAHDIVPSILQDREGHIWFSTRGGGVSRYDGQTFTTYTTQDGLADNYVYSILEDREGFLWFATVGGGVSRYDGQTFTTLTTEDGLADNEVYAALEDRDGNLWFGTHAGGVSRYDPTAGSRQGGQTFTTFTTQDGLAADYVYSVFQDIDGHFWFLTWGAGATRYDGRTFATLTTEDGLAHNGVVAVTQDRKGQIWFGTQGGVTRYLKPPPQPPPVSIDAIVADQRYDKASDLSIPTGIGIVYFEFHGLSLKTRPAALVYRYRLKSLEDAWQTTHAGRVEYYDLPRGSYTFEVVAVDRDMVYSEAPAAVTLRVHLPYERLGLIAGLIVAVILGVWQTVRIVRRDADLVRTNRDLVGEIRERGRVEAERARLDQQLQHLGFLNRLRLSLSAAWSPEDVVQKAGIAIAEALSVWDSGGVRIAQDGRVQGFGTVDTAGQIHYERKLTWGDQERGRLHLYTSVALSESQELALLDETSAQVSRALESRELQMALLESARLVSLGKTAASVAHELNQPLSAISNTAGDIYLCLTDGTELTREQLKQMMQDVLGLVKRMAGTIGHLGIFSREGAEEAPEPFSLNEVARAGIRLVEAQLEKHDIDLDVHLGDGLPTVVGYPTQIEQVVLNLVNNARDALDEAAGNSPARDKRLFVRTRQDAEGNAVLEVEDTGAGIDPTHRDQVLRPFFTTKEAGRGTGLGLSISYAIVRHHDGQMTFDSEKGKGATFRVVLPPEK